MRIGLLIFVLIISSCSKNKAVIVNNSFNEIITNYTDTYPIEIPRINISEAEGFKFIFPEPSYQIFFSKVGTDTIMSIKRVPHLIPYNPIDKFIYNHGETVYDEIKPTGYFLVNNNPIIIYDLENYSNGFLNREELTTILPDELKFEIGKGANHIESPIEYYRITNLNFERISLEKYLN